MGIGGKSVSAYSNFLAHRFGFRTQVRSSARMTGMQGKGLSRLWNASYTAMLEGVFRAERGRVVRREEDVRDIVLIFMLARRIRGRNAEQGSRKSEGVSVRRMGTRARV